MDTTAEQREVIRKHLRENDGPFSRAILDYVEHFIDWDRALVEAKQDIQRLLVLLSERDAAEAIERARELYGDDDIQIDGIADLSETDDGAWVAAWVWVPDLDAGLFTDQTHGDLEGKDGGA